MKISVKTHLSGEAVFRAVFLVLLSLFTGLYIELFGEAWAMSFGARIGFAESPLSIGAIARVALFSAGCAAGLILLLKKFAFLPRLIHRKRYLLSAVLLVLLVVFKASGSSLSCWNAYLRVPARPLDGNAPLIGFPRFIRSDEWAAFTPFCLSQTENGFAPISSIIRGVPTDVTTVYGVPSLAIVTLFRPFQWGYFFLGAERGLSFYWCGRLIALFLACYECARVYTKDNRYLSASAAVIITFSATVQWWFSTNGFVEMLIFFQLLMVLIRKYMVCRSTRVRVFCALGMVECVGGVVFTYYPAQEVPVIWLAAVMGIVLIIRLWKEFDFSPRRECAILLPAVALLGALSAGILLFSRNTISIIANTVYPGIRLQTGADLAPRCLVASLQSLFLPLNESAIVGNACEASMIFSVLPFGTLLGACHGIRKKDPLCIGLTMLQVFFLVFYLFGVPLWLARLTLMNNVTCGRLLPVMQILELILFLCGLALTERELRFRTGVILAAAASLLYTFAAFRQQPDFLQPVYIAMALAAGFLLWYGFLRHRDRLGRQILLFSCAGVIGLSGLAVNPVQIGAKAIYDNELISSIREIREDDPDALWAVAGSGFPIGNLPIMAGARTFGSTNVYPSLELWQKLDPDGQYEDIYNRYCHIRLDLTTAETFLSLLGPDYIQVSISVDDLQTLGLDYIIFSEDDTLAPDLAPLFTPLTQSNGYIICRVER